MHQKLNVDLGTEQQYMSIHSAVVPLTMGFAGLQVIL